MTINTRIELKTILILTLIFFCTSQLFASDKELTVYAAASTTGPITEIVKKFQEENRIEIKTSFASSGVLARQIEQGATADIFISASKKWADYAEDKDLLKNDTRKDFLSNTLVLIKPKDVKYNDKIEFSKDYDFPAKLTGRLSIGNPEHVPAGKYAKQSLESLNWWKGLKEKLILAKDVRSALRVVEVAEADYGIVYGSDAKKSDKVEVAGIFPANTHKPIIYVISCIKGGSNKSSDFISFLFTDTAQKIFEEYGFVPLPK